MGLLVCRLHGPAATGSPVGPQNPVRVGRMEFCTPTTSPTTTRRGRIRRLDRRRQKVRARCGSPGWCAERRCWAGSTTATNESLPSVPSFVAGQGDAGAQSSVATRPDDRKEDARDHEHTCRVGRVARRRDRGGRRKGALPAHYNNGRPHRTLELTPPSGLRGARHPPDRHRRVGSRAILGGLTHEYMLDAA